MECAAAFVTCDGLDTDLMLQHELWSGQESQLRLGDRIERGLSGVAHTRTSSSESVKLLLGQ